MSALSVPLCKIRTFIRPISLRFKRWHYRRMWNYRSYVPGDIEISKRALLAYLTEPIAVRPDTYRFSNDGIARLFPRALNELGYVVDIVEWTDAGFIPSKPYDLFIAHGGINFDKIYSRLSKACTVIYFSSGNYWKFNNEQEDVRLVALAERRGVSLPHERYINVSEETAHRKACGVITLGDLSALEPYIADGITNVKTLRNAAYPDTGYNSEGKDFDRARKHFLFFSGSGNVHKGLDLLLEAFAKLPQLHLHVVTHLQDSFVKVYAEEFTLSNIHSYGTIPMRSERFYHLMDLCGYVIHPSASDGSAGSVIECMCHGLVPIVSRATRIDVSDFGEVIEPCTIDTIYTLLGTLSVLPSEELRQRTQTTQKLTNRDYTPECFLYNLKTCLSGMIEKT